MLGPRKSPSVYASPGWMSLPFGVFEDLLDNLTWCEELSLARPPSPMTLNFSVFARKVRLYCPKKTRYCRRLFRVFRRSKGEGFSVQITTDQNVDAIAHRIKELGGTLEAEPADMPWGGRIFRLQDPDGFKFAISSPLRPNATAVEG